jgi:DNA replication initiation complex subunit (GINS family)
MYSQLYETWKQELEDPELVKLPPDFYAGIVEYVKKLKEESRMIDKRTVKANLLRKEMQNMKRMMWELIRVRYRKIVNGAAKGEDAPREALTVEEEQIYGKISPLAETVSNFASEILHGHASGTMIDMRHKRITMRLLRDVPAIVGADMKTYGPFKTEDVASFPIENAKILIKQGLAEKIVVG